MVAGTFWRSVKDRVSSHYDPSSSPQGSRVEFIFPFSLSLALVAKTTYLHVSSESPWTQGTGVVAGRSDL